MISARSTAVISTTNVSPAETTLAATHCEKLDSSRQAKPIPSTLLRQRVQTRAVSRLR